MELITIKHIMDEESRQMPLNDAFLEALSLSESCASEIEEKETELLSFLKKHPDFINHITNQYKLSVLSGWEYEIIKE